MLERQTGTAHFGDIPPKIAYHLEGQAIAVREAQLANRLITNHVPFVDIEVVEEFGHTWYHLNSSKLFSGDCNEEVINNLVHGVTLTEIKDTQVRPDIFDGRNEHPVAVIFCDRGVIYKSPGFDYEAFLQSQNWNVFHQRDKQQINQSLQEGSLTHKQMRVMQRARRREMRRVNRKLKRLALEDK